MGTDWWRNELEILAHTRWGEGLTRSERDSRRREKDGDWGLGRREVTRVAWHPQPGMATHRVVSAGKDGRLLLWDTRRRDHVLGEYHEPLSRGLTTVAWHPHLPHVLTAGTQSGTLLFWNLSGSRPYAQVADAHSSRVQALAWHPLGNVLASGGNDGVVRFWSRLRASYPPHDTTTDEPLDSHNSPSSSSSSSSSTRSSYEEVLSPWW